MKNSSANNTTAPPLWRWREKHCPDCEAHCQPSEERFQLCILADLLDVLEKGVTLNKNGRKNNE